MKYYCECVSVPLAVKLKEKGMPIRIDYDTERTDATFGACFDWLMEKGYAITVYGCGSGYHWLIDKECDNSTRGTHITQSMCGDGPNDGGCWDTWHEAANAAIEKALTLI